MRYDLADPVSTDWNALARAILLQWKQVCRRAFGAALSLLLVFPPIALAAYLTDGRGLGSFNRGDWRIFNTMVLTVLVGFGLFFLFLRSWARAKAEYERLLGALLAQ